MSTLPEENILGQAILESAINNHAKGDIKEASKFYKLYLEKGLKNANVYLNYGVICQNNNNINEAISLYKRCIDDFPHRHESYSNLGNLYRIMGKNKDAEILIRKAIKLNPNFDLAYNNLGNTLNAQKKFKEAEKAFLKAININPNFAVAINNLASLYKDQNKLDIAEEMTRKALAINDKIPEAQNNLGIILKKIGNIKEAKLAFENAIKINKNFDIAYCNLGNLLQEIGNLEEAKIVYKKSIDINPNSELSFYNLGIILRDTGKIKEADELFQKVVELKPNFAFGHMNLAICQYIQNRKELAIKSIKKAKVIDSKSKIIELLLIVISNNIFDDKIKFKQKKKIYNKINESNPLILQKDVDENIINYLHQINSLDLNKFKDPTFGNARGSDYQLFEDTNTILTQLKDDLLKICTEAANSKIFIVDSFFTILGAGGRVDKHNHIGSMDKLEVLNLGTRKYSLVYYLSVGSQDCSQPGLLKLYAPDEEVKPEPGMIVIFPSDRYHSVSYNGNKERVIVGINFYSI